MARKKSSTGRQLARQELAALRDQDRLTPDLVFRDPYFLGLNDAYAEKDLEAAILREPEAFILELGTARRKEQLVDSNPFCGYTLLNAAERTSAPHSTCRKASGGVIFARDLAHAD
jgi:hypothetical protein